MKRVQLEIVLGTILVLLSAAIVIILGIREPQRLADYEVQQRAELIEFGASVFVTNCTRCHGSPACVMSTSSPGGLPKLVGKVAWRITSFLLLPLAAKFPLAQGCTRAVVFLQCPPGLKNLVVPCAMTKSAPWPPLL